MDKFGPPAMPDITVPKLLVSQVNPAEWMYERLVRSVKQFEDDLDGDHEVGARLVSFGTELTFHIEDVGYWGPDIINS